MSHIFVKSAKVDQHVSLSVTELPSNPPNSNPFHFDSIRMGADVAKDIVAMYYTPRKGENQGSMHLINTVTGQKWNLEFTPVEIDFHEYIRLPENSNIELGFYYPYLRGDSSIALVSEKRIIDDNTPFITVGDRQVATPLYMAFGNHMFLSSAIEYMEMSKLISLLKDEYFLEDEEIKEAARNFDTLTKV